MIQPGHCLTTDHRNLYRNFRSSSIGIASTSGEHAPSITSGVRRGAPRSRRGLLVLPAPLLALAAGGNSRSSLPVATLRVLAIVRRRGVVAWGQAETHQLSIFPSGGTRSGWSPPSSVSMSMRTGVVYRQGRTRDVSDAEVRYYRRRPPPRLLPCVRAGCCVLSCSPSDQGVRQCAALSATSLFTASARGCRGTQMSAKAGPRGGRGGITIV
jgi:hypothetical protein